MNKLLLVIDLQNDFINDNTKEIVKKIDNLINSKKYDNIAFTKFINNEKSIWYKELNYRGCLSNNGQNIAINTKNCKVFNKSIYSALNYELKEYIKQNNIQEIYLCGLDTDACVYKTTLDLFENNYNVYVLKDYCMSHKSVELHNVYINNLARLIGRDKII